MSNIISLFSNNTQITFQRQEDGYINATSLCKSVGREFHTWNRSKKTIAFINELSYDTQICGTDLIQIQQGGEPHLQGTWVHPQVANFLKSRGLDVKEYEITEYLDKKNWLCKGEKNRRKATATSCLKKEFVNDLIPYTDNNGVKKVNEYGKFTVDGLVAISNYFVDLKK